MTQKHTTELHVMMITVHDRITEAEALAVVLQLASLRVAEIDNDGARRSKYGDETIARYREAIARMEELLDEMEDDSDER